MRAIQVYLYMHTYAHMHDAFIERDTQAYTHRNILSILFDRFSSHFGLRLHHVFGFENEF